MPANFQQEFKQLQKKIFGFGFLLFLACLGLSVIWQKSIKEELAEQATKLLGRSISTLAMRETIAAINGIQPNSFHSITYFGPNGEKVITLPPTIEKGYKSKNLWNDLVYADIAGDLYWDGSNREHIMGSIHFIYNRFGLAPYAIVIWFFIALWLWYFLSRSQIKIQKNMDIEFETQQALFLASLTKKIKHDIRSPLSVLEALFEEKPKDEKWFLEQGSLSIKRINEIISEVDKNKSGVYREKQNLEALYEVKYLAQQIVNEKLLLRQNHIECIFDEAICYTRIDGGKLKATLSNLLDNAIEASQSKDQIQLKISSDDSLIMIQVMDQGIGISSENLPKLCTEGFTYGKSHGSGLGLFYAKKLIEDYGGNIQIESIEGKGTTITLLIPKITTPSWALGLVNIHEYHSIVICDDQSYIRDLWKMRIQSLDYKGKSYFFSSGEELEGSELLLKDSLYLIDYDLGADKLRGTELIKKYLNPNHSFLVTGHFDDAKIQNQCSEIGCKLLAKDQISNFGAL